MCARQVRAAGPLQVRRRVVWPPLREAVRERPLHLQGAAVLLQPRVVRPGLQPRAVQHHRVRQRGVHPPRGVPVPLGLDWGQLHGGPGGIPCGRSDGGAGSADPAPHGAGSPQGGGARVPGFVAVHPQVDCAPPAAVEVRPHALHRRSPPERHAPPLPQQQLRAVCGCGQLRGAAPGQGRRRHRRARCRAAVQQRAYQDFRRQHGHQDDFQAPEPQARGRTPGADIFAPRWREEEERAAQAHVAAVARRVVPLLHHASEEVPRRQHRPPGPGVSHPGHHHVQDDHEEDGGAGDQVGGGPERAHGLRGDPFHAPDLRTRRPVRLRLAHSAHKDPLPLL
mmetsp:Transcript_70122/g.222308  ORF Transcript_70122/g.222308 Transcript_70122/m.222308 type:complete len:337 (-) Transcript_70122:169-1179(-)